PGVIAPLRRPVAPVGQPGGARGWSRGDLRKTAETRARFGLPGTGTRVSSVVRRSTPPLRALVARAAGRDPARGRVAVDDVRRDHLVWRVEDRAATVGTRGRQGRQQDS